MYVEIKISDVGSKPQTQKNLSSCLNCFRNIVNSNCAVLGFMLIRKQNSKQRMWIKGGDYFCAIQPVRTGQTRLD